MSDHRRLLSQRHVLAENIGNEPDVLRRPAATMAPLMSSGVVSEKVVPLTLRRRGDSLQTRGPVWRFHHDDRMLPAVETRGPSWSWPLGASLACHLALFAYGMQEPVPQASIGERVVSVELVVGTNTAAGRERAPSETDISAAASEGMQSNSRERIADTRETRERESLAETEHDEPEMPVVPAEPPAEKPQAIVSAPAMNMSEAPAQDPEAVASAVVDEPARMPAGPETLDNHENQPAPARPAAKSRKEVEKAPKRHDRRPPREHAALASIASVASNGTGRGRSDAETNYRGLVAAHLSRYRQFPAELRSRGEQGTATVTFRLDATGRVVSVRLVRGSGNAGIDRETEAMVHRASPFPAPPDGRAVTFTVPVSFHLR
jgi:protein TonB